MRSIRGMLFLAFFAVILVAVGIVAAVMLRTAAVQIEEYDELADELEMTRVAHWLTGYFDIHESWDDVQPYLDEMGVMYGRRVVLTDRDDRVVADTRTDESERFAGANWRTRSLQFRPTDEKVGTVHVNHDFTIVDSFRLRLARSIRRFLLLASGLAVILALLLSVPISRRMTSPIRSLVDLADRAASGDLRVRAGSSTVSELASFSLAFNRMMTDLEAASTLRKNLVADIAHELRTPLSNISGYLEGRRDGVVSDELAMTVIGDQVRVLSHLVDDLQVLAIADSGGMELACVRADIGELVSRVITGLAASASEAGVSIEFDRPDDPHHVLADPLRMAQVLSNLVKNAITHSPRNSVIVVDVATTGDDVVVSVRDSGPGIASEDLPLVFERFFRADRSRSRATGGHGLGLAIARSIVEAHGGTISVTSEAGTGSVFSVLLGRLDQA